jgi:phosphoglycerol transferase MdoB-like AlkP superfamily enzyme
MSFSVVLLIIGCAFLVSGIGLILICINIDGSWWWSICIWLASLFIIAGPIVLIVSGAHFYKRASAKVAVEIINTEYGTSYTAEQYSYQSDLILKIIDKKKSDREIIP